MYGKVDRRLDQPSRQPGDLGSFVALNVPEEARTRGFASLTFIRFAFDDASNVTGTEILSILGCT